MPTTRCHPHGSKSNFCVCCSIIPLPVCTHITHCELGISNIILEDPTIRSALHLVLQTIMNNSAEPSRNIQHNNAQHAVLFEAIGLAIHLDTSSPLVGTA